jgi:hypothetical protein
MEKAPENGKESSHSAHANGINECIYEPVFFGLLQDQLAEVQSLQLIIVYQ